MRENIERILIFICALIGLSALLITFTVPLFSVTAGNSLSREYGNIISYFTIQTNIIVVVYLFLHAFFFKSKLADKILSKTIHSAVTIYIMITGIVFFFLLSNIFKPDGLEKYSMIINHYFIPTVMFFHWVYFRKRETHSKKDFLLLQIYPLLYVVYTVIRGQLTDFYPYPFINLNKLGIFKVLLNGTGLLMFFMFISILIININKTNLLRRKIS